MNNSEKNTFVKECITDAFTELLREKELKDISVCEITDRAQVSRNSFYRNYGKKEDIPAAYIERLLRKWGRVFETEALTPAEQWGMLFGVLNEHKEFFLLLSRRDVIGVLLDAIKRVVISRPAASNVEAYAAAFVSYGVYGWVEEWIRRGMTESAEEMTSLLKATGFGAKKE